MATSFSTRELGDFQMAISRWYDRNGRDLPWRRTRDPYAIAISEFMLQQTTVVAVLPYYHAWMKRFPTVKALAAAREQEVLRAWEGLGYYSRARNLRAAARNVVNRFQGRFPSDSDSLTSLPGIGKYTAAAIASFAFNARVGVVETNTSRLLARLFDVTEPIDTTPGRMKLWGYADAIVPEGGSASFNNALMDLGALVCLPREPKCTVCPVKKFCRAKNPAALPVKRPRPARKDLSEHHSFSFRRGQVLLEQCTGRWCGMWMLPKLSRRPPGPAHYASTFSFTHHRIRLEAFSHARPQRVQAERWFPVDALQRVPMPNPHRRALLALLPAKSARIVP